MNDIFNIKRFGLVFSKDIQEKWKKYALQFLTMFGIILIVFFWLFYGSESGNKYIFEDPVKYNLELLRWSSILFLGFGILFASTFMESMREKTLRIATLSTPASHFEKFCSRWVIVTIVYIIAFFIALWLADIVRIAFLSYKYPESDIRLLDFSKLIDPEGTYSGNDYIFFSKYFFGFWIAFYALLQSLFVLGTTFCEKNSFIKTFSAVAAMVFLFIYINQWIIKIVFKGLDGFGDAMNSFMYPYPSQNNIFTTFICIFVFFSFLFWTIACFRFRESEIINRL